MEVTEQTIAAHDAHDTYYVDHSWGTTLQCRTCRVVVYAVSEGERLPYIPAGVRFTPEP